MKKIIYIILIVFIIILLALFFIFNNKNKEINNYKKQDEKKFDKEKVLKIEDPELLLKTYKNLTTEEKNKFSAEEKFSVGTTFADKMFLNKEAMSETARIYLDILENSKDMSRRAAILSRLGNFFCDAGRDEDVAKVMYSNPHMKEILDRAGGDYSLAGRYLYELAGHNLYTEIMISHWYAKQILVDKDKEKWKEYSKIMHPLMDKFALRTAKESVDDVMYYWAAMSYAAFCKMGEKKYCDDYRKAADKFKSTWSILLSAYYYVIVDNNKEKAIQKIKENMDYFKKFSDKEKTSLAVWWNNERKRNVEPDFLHKAIVDMRKLVPEFDEYIKSLED